jgi:hypothetical protein
MALIRTGGGSTASNYSKLTCVENSAKTGTVSLQDGLYIAMANSTGTSVSTNTDYNHIKSLGQAYNIFQVVAGSVVQIFYTEKSGDTNPYVSISGSGGSVSYSNDSTAGNTVIFKFA